MKMASDNAGRRRQFECIVTLGPTSMTMAGELAAAGATAFRLNTSHMTPGALQEALDQLRRPHSQLPVVLDLQGAKMRLGQFEERLIQRGERMLLVLGDAQSGELPLPHPEIYLQVDRGETLRLDDDRIRLEVEEVGRDHIRALILEGGLLRARRGINVIEHPIRLEDLTPFDASVCQMAAADPQVELAVSFVLDGREAEWVRRRSPACRLAGKVERREAAAGIDRLAAAFDSLWICRGDLGSQCGATGMASWIHGFRPAAVSCGVLMAGQVLEHLTSHPEPTRSEVCHLYDLLARGFRGIVLSDETAIGRDPVRATGIASSLLRDFGEDIP